MVIKMFPFAAIIISCVILNLLKIEGAQVEDFTKQLNTTNLNSLKITKFASFNHLKPNSVNEKLCFLSTVSFQFVELKCKVLDSLHFAHFLRLNCAFTMDMRAKVSRLQPPMGTF